MSVEPASTHALRVAHTFLQQTQEYAVIVLDTEGIVTGWLGAAERLLGYNARDACGQAIDFIFTKEDRALQMPRYELDVARLSGVSEDDRWHLRRDRTRIWVTGSMNAVRDDGGDLLGFIKLLRDRTDLKAQLGSLSHRVEHLMQDREHNLNGVARLGHEVRNPLGVISNGLDILKRRPVDGSGGAEPELLEMMERQVKAIARLSDDLLEVMRSRTGKLDLQREPLELAGTVRQAIEAMRPRYDAKPVALEVVMPDAPLPLDADPVRLQQIISNLLDNALKFTPPRGRVMVTATLEADAALIRVKDNGIGITAAMLPLIFGLFAQERRGDELANRGLGLGLALVKELAEAHGGNAEARSAGAGKGSEFSVRLPLRLSASAG